MKWLNFPTPHLFGICLEFGDEIWRQKTRIMGLPDGEEIVLTQYRHVTDGQTDGRTDRHVAIAITRYSIYAVTRKNQGCVLNE